MNSLKPLTCSHVACSVAGITADASILVEHLRASAQRYLAISRVNVRHLLAFQEPIPVEQIVTNVCDVKQGYTQYGGTPRILSRSPLAYV